MHRLGSSVLISPQEYQAFQAFLQNACGILLGSGKEYLVSSRLSGLMGETGVESLSRLLELLQAPGQQRLRIRVIDAMTTNETFWFRDTSHFSMLKEKVLPELNNQSGGGIRIWSAACSSGQEPYNLSMVAQDWLETSGSRSRQVEILATDISTRMLDQARSGVYCGHATERGMVPEQRQRYFIQRENCLEVKPEIRRRVQFRELNLTGSFDSLGRFDAIFCRNVLIYFSSELKSSIVQRMVRSLKPRGYLFLGSTESISQISDRFEMVRDRGGICYRLKD
jgi:chemotaxis protein methyltransferase CheR